MNVAPVNRAIIDAALERADPCPHGCTKGAEMGGRKGLRAALAAGKCLHPASVFDAPTAILAERIGYEVGILGGSVAALTVLGAPDLILLTLSEFVEQARRICRASALPLMCDADHGYGNALNVMRAVQELEAAGVAGMTIEDTLLPRPFGPAVPGGQVISRDEAVGKMRAALAARRDPDLLIVGRSSALEAAGLEEAIGRARAFEEAGVDAVMLTGIKRREELEAVAAATRGMLMLGQVGPALADDALLAANRVCFQIRGHQTYMAALEAAHRTLLAMRQGTPPGDLAGLAARPLVMQAERREEFDRSIAAFLGG